MSTCLRMKVHQAAIETWKVFGSQHEAPFKSVLHRFL